jgi:hypothetical protein
MANIKVVHESIMLNDQLPSVRQADSRSKGLRELLLGPAAISSPGLQKMMLEFRQSKKDYKHPVPGNQQLSSRIVGDR